MRSRRVRSVPFIPAQTRAHVQLSFTTRQVIPSHVRALLGDDRPVDGFDALFQRVRLNARTAFDAGQKLVEHADAALAHGAAAERGASKYAVMAWVGIDDIEDERRGGDEKHKSASDIPRRRVRQGVRWREVVRLDARGRALRALPGASALVNLRAIDISSNELKDLRDLFACRELREITCASNAIVSLRGLGKACAALRRLDASGNALTSESAFDDFFALRELDVRENFIGPGLMDLSSCTALELVRVSGNSICTLSGAERLLPPTLRTLDASENDIADVEEFRHLRGLKRLEELMIRGNPLEVRARHYGYDARAVAMFCAPGVLMMDGDSTAGSTFARAAERLFRNDLGHLSDDLLAMLSENVSPWVLGAYLRHACGDVDASVAKQLTSASRERDPASAMFSVSTFLPLDDDRRSTGGNDDDICGEGLTFVVDSSRLCDEEEAALAPLAPPLDSTADWLSRLASDTSDDEATLDDASGDERAEPELTLDMLRLISPIRTIGKRESSSDSSDDDSSADLTSPPRESLNASALSNEFHSLAEGFDDSSRTMVSQIERAPTSSSSKERAAPGSGTVRLLRSMSAARGPDVDDLHELSDLFDNSSRNPRHGNYVFSDDSESFVREDRDDDDDDDVEGLRSFLLTGDAEAPVSALSPRREFLKRTVTKLSRDGPTPERLAMAAKKIEEMMASLKESRLRSGDYS